MSDDHYQMPSPEIPGWMSAEELEWLYQAAKRHRDIVEVGSWMGRSTHALCSSGHLVTAVDTFEGTPSELETTHAFCKTGSTYGEFTKNCAHFNCLAWAIGDSTFVASGFPSDHVDMIFIDADHSYEAVIADLRAWWPKLKPGGLFCGHDVNEPGVIKALQEFSAEIGREVVREVGIIWSIR